MRTKTRVRLTTITAAVFLSSAGTAAAASAAPTSAAEINTAAAADGYHQIRNAAYSQCVDAPGGALNVRLRLAPCSAFVGTRMWALVPTGAPNTFFVVNRSSGLCMEVNNGTSVPGETVDEFTCNGLASEQWVLEGLTFRHAGTNQCLDTVGGRGTELMQFTCGQAAPAAAQSWIVE
jgi:hypothetical protein